jgi:hypothetical protein
MTNDQRCAVWYMRHGSAHYELCRDEQQAVRYAYNLADSEERSVSGVQFSDGRLIECGDWQALADYGTERYNAWRDAMKKDPPPPAPNRTVKSPFGGQPASADADDPGWLGS